MRLKITKKKFDRGEKKLIGTDVLTMVTYILPYEPLIDIRCVSLLCGLIIIINEICSNDEILIIFSIIYHFHFVSGK